jgi:phage repressor protein C with HTH and peptisase S24 domain
VKELKRKTARTLELKSLVPGEVDRMLTTEEVLWVTRVVWASQ